MDMAGEARGTVNFADMKLSPYFVQNSYGPFGYSMGRTATADLCMYAWQRIPEKKRPGGGVERGAINIRLQYCDQRATEAELLEIMLQLRIRGVAGIVMGAPAAIGQFGVTISPMASGFPGNVLPEVRPVAPRPAAPAPAPTAPVAPPAPEPGSPSVPPPTGGTGPAVPPPPGGGTGPTVPPPSTPGGSTGPVVPAPIAGPPGFDLPMAPPMPFTLPPGPQSPRLALEV